MTDLSSFFLDRNGDPGSSPKASRGANAKRHARAAGLFFSALLALLSFLATAAAQAPKPDPPDPFETTTGWTTKPSDGVAATLASTPGKAGNALTLSFDFHGGSGWAVAHKDFPADLPANYEFTFWIKAEAPTNTLEFKLIDPTGENVWWVRRPNFAFPGTWQKIRFKKRHIEFAWGPAGGGEMKRLAALEIAVTAGTGGKGTVSFDDLKLTPLPPEHPYDRTPKITASAGTNPENALDGNPQTAWKSPAVNATWTADFLEPREYGGLVLTWGKEAFASDYDVQISDDGQEWQTVRQIRGGNGGKDFLALPETESRHLRLERQKSPSGPGFELAEIEVEPLAFAASTNDFFTAIARSAPRGSYPRAFAGEQSYWTVVGVDGDEKEGLLSEDGALEVAKSSFSIEPFLYTGGRLLTWNDAQTTQSLAAGHLPIPSVTRRHGGLALDITALADGPAGASHLLVRYRLRNEGKEPRRVRLFLALRPFQVNPPWQFLNTPGGTAEIGTLAWSDATVAVVADGRRAVVPFPGPTGFGAATFDQGDVTDFLRRGELPPSAAADDPFRHASGALAYDFDLPPGATREAVVAVPLYPGSPIPATADPGADFDRAAATVGRQWDEKLGRVELTLPPEAQALGETLKTALAHILINRDGPALQPGSRSYERSWIRDGALTSDALLRLGQAGAARDFLLWYAPYLFPNGKVPCCVDARGADPVPENDSGGEFLFLASEYLRLTGDSTTVQAIWPKIDQAVGYLDALRAERRTEEYRAPGKRAFYGLLPESISHEGYSSRPMHSYWDDFWTLRGYKDAVDLAVRLGHEDDAARYAASRDQFRRDLYASLAETLRVHKIDYIPGCAELGDLDPTSTTIALAPGGELARLPPAELRRTFERYYEGIEKRRRGEWENYTPYEWRTVGAFVRLGWRDRAQELIEGFLADRRPAAWNQWAEVVWKDVRAPKFIGDMPHTWVASDFIRSTLDLFAYDRESDGALVLAAGIPRSWVEAKGGTGIHGLVTAYGKLDFRLAAGADGWTAEIGGGLRVPPGGIALHGPWPGAIESATVGGKPLPVSGEGEIVVRELPARVEVRFRGR
jgi:hypothetical protein